MYAAYVSTDEPPAPATHKICAVRLSSVVGVEGMTSAMCFRISAPLLQGRQLSSPPSAIAWKAVPVARDVEHHN